MLTLFLLTGQVAAQTNKVDLYSDFLKDKPKCKKIILHEVRYDIDDDPSDTILISVNEWTKNQHTQIQYFENIFDKMGCNESKTIKIYNTKKRNSLITKYYKCDSLLSTKYRIKTDDSSFTYRENKEIISRSKHNRQDNSWTSNYISKGAIMKSISFEDSLKEISFLYKNDTLIEKNIDYKRKNILDSILYFSYSGILTYKTIWLYNKLGDVAYEERIDYSKKLPDTVKTSMTYIYDKNGIWIERTNLNEYYPQTEILFEKEYKRGPKKQTFFREVIY